MMPNPQLEKRRHNLLREVAHLTDLMGYAPSIRQLKDTLGYSTTSLVHRDLRALESRGLLSMDDGVSRSLRLTAAGRDSL